jgi:hypothetical protein
MARSPAVLRPFGRAQDLDVEFADEDRPRLVTALLSLCSESSDAEFWWDQTVGTRIGALLRVLAQTEGNASGLTVTLRCRQSQCGEPFEVVLSFNALFDAAPTREIATAQPDPVVLPDGRSVAVRRPTGRDLRNWSAKRGASRHEAVAAMLDTLVVEGSVGPDDAPVIAEAMATHDPLVSYFVSCACPTCGVESEQRVDLEAVALARLGARQRALLREIHVLASQYGWTEGEILAIAPARRARYLDLIEDRP